MTKKKSIWAFVLALCLIMPTMFMLTACGKDKGGETTHTHTYSSEWEKDPTYHWHTATCEHTDEKGAYGEHTFGDWTVKTPATTHHSAVEKCTCTQCGFEKTRLVENSALHDDYELIWESDETGHWYKCSCGRQVDFAEHTYGNWSEKTPAGVDQDKQFSRKCSECEYEDVITFNGTKTNGKYCMSINEVIKISDSEKVVKVKILRGTIISGDNVNVDGISGTFSIDKITNNRIEVTSASCGQEVELTLVAEDGNLEDISNRKSGYLMYEPDTIKSYKTFTAQIRVLKKDGDNVGRNTPIFSNTTFDQIVFNEKMGIRGTITFSNSNDMIKPGETQIVTITFTSEVAILEGMDFIINETRDSVTRKTVEGTILTVVNEEQL